jgi:hypothetical protein
MKHPVGTVLMESNIHPLPAHISLADRAILVRTDFDNTTIFDLDF